MTTKFYQINGVWNTYQYWHDNYGYTTEPTQSMNFKSSASGTWGTDVNPGYFTSPGGYTIDNWSFWSDGIVGWKDIDQLALAGAYPATAIDILLERNGAIANAVYVDDSDELYYLIDGFLSDGWRPWNEVEADGWQVYEGNPPYYIVVNETTGEIVYSISETEENPSMVFSQVGYIEMPDSEMITVYETGVRTESFYFTTNGRNETENTDISHSTIPVYLEDGTAPAADTPYDGSSVLAFMDVDGNTKQADGESLYLDDGVLMLDAPDTDEGEQWSALVEKVFPDILTLWAKTIDNSEKMYLQTRVINTSTPNSTYLYALYTDEALTQRFVIDSNKIYELGVFNGQNFVPYDVQDVSQMPSTTVSGSGAVFGYLLVDQSGSYLWAATNNTYSTYTNAPGNKLSFKCRVSEPPAPSLPTVSTSGDFGTDNWLFANTQGADVTVSSGNSTLVGLSGGMTPTAVNYDATKAYAVVNWSSYQSASGSGHAEFSIVDSSGNIYAQNNSSGSLKLYALRCAVCSDSTATVITVYSSTDGTAYNSFKYTASGTDYYYVLDETQTDWTDDLSSIGYSLEPPAPSEFTGYYTNQGEAGKNTTVNASMTTLNVYDASGNKIPYDTTKTYTVISAKGTYQNNSTIRDWTSVLITNTSVRNNNGFLCTYCGISSYGGYNVYISEVVIGIS